MGVGHQNLLSFHIVGHMALLINPPAIVSGSGAQTRPTGYQPYRQADAGLLELADPSEPLNDGDEPLGVDLLGDEISVCFQIPVILQVGF